MPKFQTWLWLLQDKQKHLWQEMRGKPCYTKALKKDEVFRGPARTSAQNIAPILQTMEQRHADNIGGWDPNSFISAGNEWDQHHYGGFDPHSTGGESSYPSEFLGSAPPNQQLSVQGAEYRDFDMFDQGSNVWSNTSHVMPSHGHAQSQPAYAQDPAIHPSLYLDQPHQQDSHQSHAHQPNPNSTVARHFALDIPQGRDFSSHLHGTNNQEAPVHGFGSNVVNTTGSAQNGYAHPQNAIPQWQGQMQTSYGAGPHHQYENPLAASAVQHTASPFSGRGSVQAYQVEPAQRPAVQSRQMHMQFQTAPNGQPQQPQMSAAQVSGSVPGSPHVSIHQAAQKPVAQHAPQQAHQQVMPQQALPQQIPQQVPQQVSQQVPQQMPQQVPRQPHRQNSQHQMPQQMHAQFSQPVPQPQQQATQPTVAQQHFPQHAANQPSPQQLVQVTQSPQLSPHPAQKQVAQQPVLAPQGNVPAAQTLAKKARAVGSASPSQHAQHSQHIQQATPQPPTAQPRPALPNYSTAVNGINFENTQLLQSPQALNGPKWAGSTYLVFGTTPARLQQSGTPTKRYVMLSTKSDKPPLFPDSNIGWIAAESLGHHLHAYQAATSDAERYQADVRLDIEMSRSGNEIPADWYKKLLKVSVDPARVPAPPEPEKTAIIAREKVRIHPAHVDNAIQIERAYIDYGSFLSDKTRDLLKAMKAKADGNDAAEADETDLKVQLERAIAEGLEHGHPTMLSKLGGKEKALLPALLVRVLGRLFSTDAASSLSKVILQLFARFTSMTLKQLEFSKMTAIKEKLRKRGDDEVKGLVDRIFKIAEENGGDSNDSSSGNAAAKTSQNGAQSKQKEPVKKASTQAQALATSKQTATSATSTDSKKVSASSAIRPTKSGSDPKSSSAFASSKIDSTTESKKLATKSMQKPSLTSPSAGVKRSREDDAAGEARSSKKPANENNVPMSSNAAGAKPSTSSLLGKPTGTNKSTVVKSSTSGTTPSSSLATATTKARSSLLLPGKSRPIAKPVSKSDLAKAEVKVPPKTDSTTKTQPAKTASQTTSAPAKVTKPKPAEMSKETSSTRSAFSALMEEIHQPKKVNAPVVPAKAEPEIDPNETPEQRERRLRKERRRAQNLKVTWRAGDALVEIREFTRDPEEIAEQGKAFGTVKTDARGKFNDEASHFRKVNSRMGIKSIEIGDREWEAPTAVDFGHIPQEKRQETYDTHGGLKSVESKEQKVIQDRESNELMVIYHTLDDVPATPRSPHHELPTSNTPPVYGCDGIPAHSTPNHEEIMRRVREVRAWGTTQASRIALARLEAKARPQAPPPTSVVITDSAVWFNPAEAARRDQATWDLLTSERLRKWGDLHPNYPYNPDTPRPQDDAALKDPAFVKAMGHIQAVIESLKVHEQQMVTAAAVQVVAQPLVPVLAPVVPQPAPTVAPVQATAATTVGAGEYAAAWAQYYAQQQQQQQAWAGHQQNAYSQATNPYAQQQQAAQPPQPQQATEINALLAQLGNQSVASQPQHAAAVTQDPQVQALLAALGGGSAQAQAPAVPAPADTQNAQYLLDMLKWSQSQGQAQAQIPTTNASSAPIYGATSQAPSSASYQSHQPAYERYNSSQSYGNDRNDRNERPSKPVPDYGAMYDDSTYEKPQQNNNYHDRDDNVNGYPGGSSRRDRDRDYHAGGGGGHKKHGKKNKGAHGGGASANNGGDNDNDVPEHLRGINRSLIGTKQCAFWAKGTCAKGDKCTFRHD
ncbi:hypothetical protein QBC43DRAFT_285414 [Cladorrhinum sp. PSN259]|nr:hypothetical protein QBC43DRAFT_285414 [Cladorrhinum sp. PSN259]